MDCAGDKIACGGFEEELVILADKKQIENYLMSNWK